jgi:hypothetical protein
MDNDRRRNLIAAVAFATTIAAVLLTTLKAMPTRDARNDAQPGTIGLARPHAPLDRAPGEPLQQGPHY